MTKKNEQRYVKACASMTLYFDEKLRKGDRIQSVFGQSVVFEDRVVAKIHRKTGLVDLVYRSDFDFMNGIILIETIEYDLKNNQLNHVNNGHSSCDPEINKKEYEKYNSLLNKAGLPSRFDKDLASLIK